MHHYYNHIFAPKWYMKNSLQYLGDHYTSEELDSEKSLPFPFLYSNDPEASKAIQFQILMS